MNVRKGGRPHPGGSAFKGETRRLREGQNWRQEVHENKLNEIKDLHISLRTIKILALAGVTQ